MLMVLREIERERPAVILARAQIQGACSRFLAQLAATAAQAQRLAAPATKVQKMGRDDEDPATRAVEDAAWEALRDEVRPHVEAVAKDGAAQAAAQVELQVAAALQQANEEAIRWAEQRAAELVTEISSVTRERIRELVVEGLKAGKSNAEIATEIAESVWFSEARATTVSRTETAMADLEGNRIGWHASGVVSGREWRTDNAPCEDCAAMDGVVVGVDEEFEGGNPPRHPRCECVELPVLAVDDE